MNSYSANRSQTTPSAASFDSYQFDFGLVGAGRSSGGRPLRNQNPSAPSRPATNTATWSHQPSSNKPSWTHEPATATATTGGVARSGNLANAPASMVGDIFGKSWTSAAPPSSSSGVGLGIPKSDPKLFSDLVGSALGSGGSSVGSAPLKSAAPKAAFSMGNLSDSLPKSTLSAATNGAPMRPSGSRSGESFGNFVSFSQPGPKIGAGPIGGSAGQPMKSTAGGAPMNAKDPFGSLTDFGSKPATKTPMSASNLSHGGDADFFGAFHSANSTKKIDNATQAQSFKIPTPPAAMQQPDPASKSAADPMDMFFPSSNPATSAPPASAASEMNDWDLGSEFTGDDNSGPTTELEGLPPPPAGVTASAAKTKGVDNYKQGQYADAIKWLSWAVALLEKSGDSGSMTEVLSCRASSYKEAGEYKKAVADCSKVLEKDSTNVAILVQRALLYESMEKYRLGAEDLRTVLKIDPGNRLARSTIHRLNKFAE